MIQFQTTARREPSVTEAPLAEILDQLTIAYNAEIETVANYLANSVNLDGIRADPIKRALANDISTELGHAQKLARRIKVLGGLVPGSQKLEWTQGELQAREKTTDVLSVIRGVIAAEDAAIDIYQRIIRTCDGVDYVTQELAIENLEDEQEHRREFLGYLKEYEQV